MTNHFVPMEIPISFPTGDILLQFAPNYNSEALAELSRILSIPVRPATSNMRTAILMQTLPDMQNGVYEIPLKGLSLFHIYHLANQSLGILQTSNQDSDVARTWRGLLLFSLFFAILRGAKLCFLHGTVLKHRDNSVSILFGESGIGKSTTAKRYRALGGEVVCDDQMLLHLHPDNSLTVSALPTWSRIKPSAIGTNETYDVLTEYKIRRFCRLSRGLERESLEYDSEKSFRVRLLKEITMHTYKMLSFLPVEDRSYFGPFFLHFMDVILTKGKPQVLYANLNAILTDTLSID